MASGAKKNVFCSPPISLSIVTQGGKLLRSVKVHPVVLWWPYNTPPACVKVSTSATATAPATPHMSERRDKPNQCLLRAQGKKKKQGGFWRRFCTPNIHDVVACRDSPSTRYCFWFILSAAGRQAGELKLRNRQGASQLHNQSLVIASAVCDQVGVFFVCIVFVILKMDICGRGNLILFARMSKATRGLEGVRMVCVWCRTDSNPRACIPLVRHVLPHTHKQKMVKDEKTKMSYISKGRRNYMRNVPS